jgi:hypothetical protein
MLLFFILYFDLFLSNSDCIAVKYILSIINIKNIQYSLVYLKYVSNKYFILWFTNQIEHFFFFFF